MTAIKAVIFDMYQTLVQDPADQWRVSFQTIAAEQGLDATPDELWRHWRESEAQFRQRRTDPSQPFQTYFDAWAAGFRQAFLAMGLPPDSIQCRANAATRRFCADLSQRPPFPETAPVLRQLQADGYRIAVLSNADDGYLLPNLKLLDFPFDAVLSSEMARCYKPQPALFREMLRRLSLPPEATIYIGDRHYEDVFGASQVGIPAVWLDRGGRGLQAGLPPPRHRIANLRELPALLQTRISTGEAPE